jgi:hypothetical protein
MRFFVVTLNAHPTPAGVRREPNALRRLFSSSHSIADSGFQIEKETARSTEIIT